MAATDHPSARPRREAGMLYKFKTKVSGDVIMLAPNGDHVMRVIGREPAPKGIIEPADMPAAMRAIEHAIALDDAARADRADSDDGGGSGGAPDARPDKVSLRQRAWPLVEMMKRAHAAGEPIVWGV